MNVVYFQRKPREHGNFSIELLFDQIRAHLPADITCETKVAHYHSGGVVPRLRMCLDAMREQGEINHVTGDINFLASVLSGPRTVLTVHDVGMMNHPNPLARKVLQWFWVSLPVKRAGFVTTVSAATKRELLKYVDVDERKVRVIHVPVAPGLTYAPREFNSEHPVILHIGCAPNKNLPRLAEALQGLRCRLEIIGKPSEAQEEKLAQHGIDYGWSARLSNDELRQKYEACDMLAFASTYEGFGMPIVEANIVGRPVVTGNLLSMPEVAGDAAQLVDPFDVKDIRAGIERVIGDAAYRARLVERGRVNAERFAPATIAAQYAALYREMRGA